MKQTRVVNVTFLALVAIAWCSGAQARLRPGQSLSAGQATYSDSGKYLATMQHDGNFVVYRNDGHAIWSTNTTGLGAVIAIMQHDGNFVLYDAASRPVWWTASNGPGRMFSVTEAGQAVVTAPGHVQGYVWSANLYDLQQRLKRGPRCHGNPRKCAEEGRRLHFDLLRVKF